MSERRDRGRTFRGFAALERDGGPIIWGTLRPTAAEARRQFLRWNPQQEPIIQPVTLTLPVCPYKAP